jgi:porphobilinogen synthase
MRRLRQTESLRSLVRETHLEPTNFIYPLFVCPGQGVRKEISSMPGVFNISLDEAVKEAREAKQLGIGGIILFGLPEKKDEVATGAWSEDGIVQRATRAIKSEVRDLTVIGDVCLCEYMSHGHCGIVEEKSQTKKSLSKQSTDSPARVMVAKSRDQMMAAATKLAEAAAPEYEILNDPTLEILARTAVSQAQAGMRRSARVWTKPASSTRQYSLTRRNLHPASMGPFAKPLTPRHNSAIAGHIRWMAAIFAKPCVRSSWTFRKART